MSGFFPTRTFNRLGYAELRDIHPGWATSYYTAKGYKCFADIFSDSLQSQGGGRITESVSALINGGVGTAWLNGVYKKPQTSRITIDRFALVNSAASLCQTAFLGTQTADWGQLLWYDADPLFPTQPCALFNYSSIVYSGFLKATNTIPVYVSAVRIGDGSSLQWKLVGDLSSALDRLTSADLSFSGGITSVVTQNCSSVSVGWYDETASAGISGKFEAGIALSDIAIEYPLTGFPDPFENDPAAAEGQWKLVSTVMGEDQLIIIGIEPAEIWIDDDHWGPDPKAVFADGSTSKTLAQGYIRPRDGMGDVLDLYMSVDLAFKGREFVAPCPWMGPTQGKDPEYDGSGKNDHCLLPVTFNQQLYSAGLVRTALPSYTSVGVQANLAAAASVADSNLFEFPSTLETDAAVYTKYAPAPMKFGSKVGWENGWRSFVEKADVDADIAACIAESMKGSQTFDPTKFLHTYDPTSAAALGGYGSNKHALDTMMSSLRSSFATDDATTAEIVQGTFQPNSYESITDGVIPADYHLGIVTFHVRFAPDKDKLSDVRRSSYAAAWDKKALPLAYWNFPAMKVVE